MSGKEAQERLDLIPRWTCTAHGDTRDAAIWMYTDRELGIRKREEVVRRTGVSVVTYGVRDRHDLTIEQLLDDLNARPETRKILANRMALAEAANGSRLRSMGNGGSRNG